MILVEHNSIMLCSFFELSFGRVLSAVSFPSVLPPSRQVFTKMSKLVNLELEDENCPRFYDGGVVDRGGYYGDIGNSGGGFY